MSDQKKDIALSKQVDDYINGRLTDEETEVLWVALLKEPEYLDRLQTEVDLNRLKEFNRLSESKAGYFWKWVAAAAAIVLIILSGSFLFHQNSANTIQGWALAEIEIVQNFATAEVSRSTQSLSHTDSLLNAGFQSALLGQSHKAIGIYQEMLKENHDTFSTLKAHLNLGILQYNEDAYSKSIDSFNQAIELVEDNPLLKGRLYWYLSNAMVHNGQLVEARNTAQKAFELSILYKKESKKLSIRLDYALGTISQDSFHRQMQNLNN